MVTNPTYIRKDAQIIKGSFTAAFGVFLLLAEWIKKTNNPLLNGCSVKNAMSARPVNLPVSKLPVVCQSEPSPRSGKQPFKRHKQKNRCMVYGVGEICNVEGTDKNL